MKPSRKNGPRSADGKFAAGNPGRPKGARHRVTKAVEALLEGQAEALTQRAIAAALSGDSTALRLCLERIAPAPKDRPIVVDAPIIKSAADIPAALGAVLTAVAAGELTPSEGIALAAIIEKARAAHELADIEARLRALEGKVP
ncbi:MAG: hypothetical protein JO127_10005 [Caulobacteraceae bacterium]|nr:hypothetical protein [Caulobacteraceae bacterium]